MQSAPQLGHELRVRHRRGAGRVKCPAEIIAFETGQENPIEVGDVNPADVLPAVADRAPEKKPGDVFESAQGTLAAFQGEADSEQKFAGPGEGQAVEGGLPCSANLR